MPVVRRYVTPLAVVAAAILIYMENPFVEPPEALGPFLSVGFWVITIIVAVTLFADRKAADAPTVEIEAPAVSRYLFSNTRAGLFWLPIRLFVGFSWFEAGLEKLFPAGKAIGAGWLDGGASLAAYWTRAAALPEPPARAPIAFEWYREFLNILLANDAQTWFAYLIVFGEIAVGVGLLFGILTGIAAFFGATMNMSFMLAGSASTNPVLFAGAVGLMLAWRVAGYHGLDRYLLPLLGVPWARRVTAAPASAPATTPILG